MRSREPGEQASQGSELPVATSSPDDGPHRCGEEERLGERREEEEGDREDRDIEDRSVSRLAIEILADKLAEAGQAEHEGNRIDHQAGQCDVVAHKDRHRAHQERQQREEVGGGRAGLVAVGRDLGIPARVPVLPYQPHGTAVRRGGEYRGRASATMRRGRVARVGRRPTEIPHPEAA